MPDASETPNDADPAAAGESVTGSAAAGPTHRVARDWVAWTVSLTVHVALAGLLAAATLPAAPLAAVIALVSKPTETETLDEAVDLSDLAVSLPTSGPHRDASTTPPPTAAPAETPTVVLASPREPLAGTQPSLPPETIATPIDVVTATLGSGPAAGRTAAGRAALVAAKGGSPESEAAVGRALRWLAQHQNADGTWSLVHTVGACRGRCGNPARIPSAGDPARESVATATALALLPFLGAGETPDAGRHRRVVRRGLAALSRLGSVSKDAPGRSWMDSGRMYAHGIAATALCEAYGLSGDAVVGSAAQDALAFLAYAQDPEGGGWRYTPRSRGDASVTGWQVMAVKSGALGGLATPPRLKRRAIAFFDSVSVAGGAEYRYEAPRIGPGEPDADPAADEAEQAEEDGEEDGSNGARPTISAVGLLCRMYLGWEQDDPRLVEGVRRLADAGPSRNNFYHNYYTSQAVFHQTGGTGPVWSRWNEPLREQLIRQQATRGHERGSWWTAGPYNNRGGRLYATALATLTLEVYYRYLPLYRSEAVELELPD